MIFWKMNGLGNDYIFIDAVKCPKDELKKLESNLKTLIPRICDRHFGVGGDGIVIMYPSRLADVRMRMFNADGSEGIMCGNAVRCIAKYLTEVCGRTGELAVETKAGIRTLAVTEVDGKVVSVRAEMGKVRITGREGDAIFADIGNPHAVIEGDPACEAHIARAAELSRLRDVNVETVRAVSEHVMEMRVWERGSGETLACGTGACAAAYVLAAEGKLSFPVTVRLRGGELTIEYIDGRVYASGKANLNYIGELNISDYG